MVVVTLVHPAPPRRISATGPLLKLRSDEQLLALFRDGNEEAFTVIFDRHRSRLLRYTRRMLGGSAAEAEDVLQDVFVRAYRSLAVDQRELPLKAWLYRVAHNRCVDHLRRPVTDNAAVYEVNRPAACDPHERTEQRESLRRLVRDVGELPEQQRSALLLRELEGLSYTEVAATLNVSVPAVKSLLVRARGGLIDAQEAEDTACVEVHASLDDARARGVRMSGLARRHMLTCGDCRQYHASLRSYDKAVAAVDGGPGPLAAFAKLLGFGSAGGGAAAAAGGGTAVSAGGFGVLTAAGVKTIAVLGAAAVVGGGAVEVTQHLPETAKAAEPAVLTPTSRAAPLAAPLRLVHKLQTVTEHNVELRTQSSHAALIAPVTPVAAPPMPEADEGDEAAVSPDVVQTGGVSAPTTLVDDPPSEEATPEPTNTTTPTTTEPVTTGAVTPVTPAPATVTTAAEPAAAR